jgi:chromosomal replication initiator protein
MTAGKNAGQTHFTGVGAASRLWQACVDQLAQELPEQQFNTWIKPLSAQVSDDQLSVTIFVANRFKLDWIRAQYGGRISTLLGKFSGQTVQIELALAPREPVARANFPQRTVESIPVDEPVDASEDRSQGALKNRLNTALNFDTLIEGTANRMARAAAMHVAGMPGHLYNPLFIYGGVGLGKTHLMPKFYTFMLSNLSQMWLKPTNAKHLMSLRSDITRWICF